MEIGTAEIAEAIDEQKRRSARPFGGSQGPGNDRGRGPGGGGDRPDDDAGGSIDRFVPAKSRILTGFLLVVVGMTFAGLMAAYVMIATNKAAEWHPFDLPFQVWISTALILASSLTYHLGKIALDRSGQLAARKWFIVTTVLGAAFISSQLIVWLALVARGYYMQGNPYAGFFYTLTAVHVAHVLGGIVALGSILLRVWHPTLDPQAIVKRRTVAQVVGWYWHFVGGLWLALLVLLGFWK